MSENKAVADRAPDLTRRETFRHWTRVTVRYNDLDPLGHVNNVAMAVYFEQARCELVTPHFKAQGRHLDMVLASAQLDYLRELHYPGEVEIGTIALKVGTKSFTLANCVFQDGVCAGTGTAVLVAFDLDKRTSIEIPAAARKVIEGLRA